MKNVFVQGLGFVGSAMATAIALAKDSRGNLLYKVTGVDLPNKSGQKRWFTGFIEIFLGFKGCFQFV